MDEIHEIIHVRVCGYIIIGDFDAARSAIARYSLDVNHVPKEKPQWVFFHVALESRKATETQLHAFLDFLLERGANINFRTQNDVLPFHLGACLRHISHDTLRYLIRNGADAASVSEKNGWNVFHEVSADYISWPIDIIRDRVRFLVAELGLDVNAVNFKKCTALMYAVGSSSTSYARVLLEFGADPNITSNLDYTAFTNAAMLCTNDDVSSLFECLVKHGADPFQKHLNRNALELLFAPHKGMYEKKFGVSHVKCLVKMGIVVTDAFIENHRIDEHMHNAVRNYLRNFPKHHFKALLRHLQKQLLEIALETNAGRVIAAKQCDLQINDVDPLRMFQVPYHCLFESMEQFMTWARERSGVFCIDDVVISALRAEITTVISALSRVYEHSSMGRAQLQATAEEMVGKTLKRERRE